MLQHEHERTGETPEHLDPELLIEEARRRGRRRRSAAVAALLLAGVGVAAFSVFHRSDGPTTTAQLAPKGVFVDSRAFAGHGLLAFVSRGRLFVLDGETQKLTAVTALGQQASDPQFSPDGRWLSYWLGSGKTGLAHADGDLPHIVGKGGARWLPDGRLLLGNSVDRVGADGRPIRIGSAPSGAIAWSPDGDRFAFVTRHLTHGSDGAFHGVEQLQVANSLTGPRTTWLAHPIAANPNSGFIGYAINGFIVLTHREGVLYWSDPDQSASLAADGMTVYLLRKPHAQPVKLGTTVGHTTSATATGRLALATGGNRYAWITKTVETCAPSSARCKPLPAPPGKLTLDPSWSPDGRTLAFVEARAEPAGDFRQATVTRWYSTRSLWLLNADATTLMEIADTRGATAPTWSADGKSLLYVAGDALWLIPRTGAKPEKIAGPLFPSSAWPSYYGQIDWTNQFAWSHSPVHG